MNALYFVVLLGTFTYHCSENARNFRGSSKNVFKTLLFSSWIGSILYHLLLAIGFIFYPWWQPIMTWAVTTFIIRPISAIAFQRTLLGIILSPIIVVVSSIISIILYVSQYQ